MLDMNKRRILDEIYDYALDNLDLFLKDFEEREPELYRQFVRNAGIKFVKDSESVLKRVEDWKKAYVAKVDSAAEELAKAKEDLRRFPETIKTWIDPEIYEANRKQLERYWK